MKSIFRSTAILSGGSIVTIGVGLVSAKVMASILQPAGYGYYGLLQSFVGLTGLVAGLGMSTGLVRLGAAPVASNDQAAIAGLRRGAWLLFGGMGAITATLLVIFRRPLGLWVLGFADDGETLALMALPILLTVAASIQSGTLNAYHRVKALANVAVVSAVFGGGSAIACVLLWHARGIVPAVISASVVSLAVSSFFIVREVGPIPSAGHRQSRWNGAWSLFRFGGPYTASMLVGSGVQLAMPILVLHLLNTESVGYYRAAAAISVNYLGFLITAMGQDYYPRVSAVRDEPESLVPLMNEQHRLVMLLAVPMILGTLALVPYLVPLVYSSKFAPAVAILEWQLIGDIFKFSSWTMSFVVLARCSSFTYFLIEGIGGVIALATAIPAVRWLGLPGLGISFLATYVLYYFVVWIVVRGQIPLRWTANNKRMLLIAVAAAIIVRLLPATRLEYLRTPLALIFAAVAGISSVVTIYREFVGPNRRMESRLLNSQPEEVLTSR